MLEAYRKDIKPLTIIFGDRSLSFKNLNQFSVLELCDYAFETFDPNKPFKFLKNVVASDASDLLDELTSYQLEKIVKQLETDAGFDLQEFLGCCYLVETLPTFVQADLGTHTTLGTISALLETKPLDFMNVMMAILKVKGKESFTVAENQGLSTIYSDAWVTTQLLWSIAQYTAQNGFAKWTPKFPDPLLKSSDKGSNGFIELEEQEQIELDEQIKHLRETGSWKK